MCVVPHVLVPRVTRDVLNFENKTKHSAWSNFTCLCNFGFVDVASSPGRRYRTALLFAFNVCLLSFFSLLVFFRVGDYCGVLDQSTPLTKTH